MVKVGIVDSGFAPHQATFIKASAAFMLHDDALWQCDCDKDRLLHGSRIVDVVHRVSPHSEIFVAQVFRDRFVTTAVQVAAAIDWLCEQNVQVINLSLGLRTDRPVLQQSVARAVEAGVLLCASSPAKGDAVYPSAYPGVLRTTGDARCAPDEWSLLATQYADFGAHVRSLDDHIAGASMGTAYMSGHIARFLSDHPGAGRAALGHYLKQSACYFGAEHRTA